MKFVLAFLLCGLCCCLASPTCVESEIDKCIRREVDHDRFYPESEADQESFCSDSIKEFDCKIAFTDRCSSNLLAALRKLLFMYKESYERLCDKAGSLRQKLLEKGSCINREEKAGEDACSEKVTEQEFCKKIELNLKCAEEELNSRCGSDGSEVYTELYKPKYAFKKIFCEGDDSGESDD